MELDIPLHTFHMYNIHQHQSFGTSPFLDILLHSDTTYNIPHSPTLEDAARDYAIELLKDSGKEITEIFAEIGNEGFRKLEAEVIACVSREHQGAVIATGGGAILRDDNVRALKRCGRIYFLNRPIENIVPTADRPLALDRAALEARFRERYARYLSTCDKEIKTAESVSETANMISEDFFQ